MPILAFRTLHISSEPQRIVHQDHMNPADMPRISGDQKLTADRILRFAVKAFAGLPARCFDIKALSICRCSYISGTFHSLVKIRTDFVHSNKKNYLLWSLGDTGNTVGIAININ